LPLLALTRSVVGHQIRAHFSSKIKSYFKAFQNDLQKYFNIIAKVADLAFGAEPISKERERGEINPVIPYVFIYMCMYTS
jgi:hypothetical protein